MLASASALLLGVAAVIAAGVVPTRAERPPDLAAVSSDPAAPHARPSGPLVVVGLGDSVPAAGGCACRSYVSLTADQLARRSGRSAQVDNLAVGGETTSSLLDRLRQPAVRAQISDADVVLVTIGANDFDPRLLTSGGCQPISAVPCYQDTLDRQRTLLTDALGQVTTLTAAKGAQVVVTGYWNVFLDGDVGRAEGDAYVTGSDALTRQDNDQIAAVAAAGGSLYVDVYAPFKGDGSQDDTALLAPDGDHPDQAGHDLIARTLVTAL